MVSSLLCFQFSLPSLSKQKAKFLKAMKRKPHTEDDATSAKNRNGDARSKDYSKTQEANKGDHRSKDNSASEHARSGKPRSKTDPKSQKVKNGKISRDRRHTHDKDAREKEEEEEEASLFWSLIAVNSIMSVANMTAMSAYM